MLWFAIGVAVGAVPVLIVFYAMRGRNVAPSSFDSGQISELIGKIQHVTSVNVDTIERKIIDLKTAVNQANSVYIKLNEAISDTNNVMTKPPPAPGGPSGRVSAPESSGGISEVSQKEEIDFTGEIGRKMNVKSLTRNEKVLELNRKGWSSDKIAESLDMGVGEVELIVGLASKFFGEEAQ